MKKVLKKPLSPQDLAQLYLQLGRLEESGIPIQQAMMMVIQTGGQIGTRAEMTLNYLKRGQSLFEAGRRAGLFIGLDAALVEVAEAGGRNADVFRQMAQFYEEKARQQRKIKSRLVLPITIFLLAVFIQPFPAFFLGKITLAGYLVATVGLIIQLSLLVFIILRLPRWLRYGFLSPFGGWWDKLEMHLPHFGRWTVRQNLRDFMRSLALMVQAGLPILEALPKAYKVVENSILRRQLQKISHYLRVGDTFAEAFSKVNGINPVAIQLVLIGEHAGSLAEMMLHYAKLESEDIALHNDMLAEWVPRVVYTTICIWMVFGILSSGPPMSQIPDF